MPYRADEEPFRGNAYDETPRQQFMNSVAQLPSGCQRDCRRVDEAKNAIGRKAGAAHRPTKKDEERAVRTRVQIEGHARRTLTRSLVSSGLCEHWIVRDSGPKTPFESPESHICNEEDCTQRGTAEPVTGSRSVSRVHHHVPG